MEAIMKIYLPDELISQIQEHGESAYPEEGAGLMLGIEKDGKRQVQKLLMFVNKREESARHNRYLLTAEDMLEGEKEAEASGLNIVGIFHSHPDHPDQPSDFDREYAIPWYSYLITSVQKGKAVSSKCWRLNDDRSFFEPEEITKTS
jgi:proteasome lid subunit RPN8/RPN11